MVEFESVVPERRQDCRVEGRSECHVERRVGVSLGRVIESSAKVSSRQGLPAQSTTWRHSPRRTRPAVEGNHLQTVVTSCACTRRLHGGSRLIQNPGAQTTRTLSSRTWEQWQWALPKLRPVARTPHSSRTCEKHRTDFIDVPGPHSRTSDQESCV